MTMRTGAVIIADEASLHRVGPTNGFEWTFAQLSDSARPHEILVVTDCEAIRALCIERNVRCLTWQDLGPVAWAGVASDVSSVQRASVWPASRTEDVASPDASGGDVPSAKRDQLARLNAGLKTGWPGATGLLTRLGLELVIFVDACCPLWEVADLDAVLEACDSANRAFLARHPERIWVASEQGRLEELTAACCAELETMRAFRLQTEPSMPSLVPVPAAGYKGWSLRHPAEREAIGVVWAQQRVQTRLSSLPPRVGAVAMDFDGVLTDNRVLVAQDGTESVSCHRGDGLGLGMLRDAGIGLVVISKERNPVVGARCSKLQITCLQGIDEKLEALQHWAREAKLSREEVLFVGNDINDLECLRWAGCGVAVADSHNEVLRVANVVLDNRGGCGAIRELCEMVLLRNGIRVPVVSS